MPNFEKIEKKSKKTAKKCEKIDKNQKKSTNEADISSNERVEDLQCRGLKIIQNRQLYTFSSDSVILANFVKTKASDEVLEIGTGSGVISILVQAKNKLKKIYAFELQEEMAKLCEKNLKLNNISQIDLIFDDIKNFERYIKRNSIDVVFSNPPYFKETNFNQSQTRKIAREEVKLNCEEICQIASQILKVGGTFYVCYKAERSVELIYNLQKNKLAVKEMFFTENGKGKIQTVFIRAVKGGNFGTIIRQNLSTNDADGNYLEKLHTKNF